MFGLEKMTKITKLINQILSILLKLIALWFIIDAILKTQ